MKVLHNIVLVIFCLSIIDPSVCAHFCKGAHDHHEHTALSGGVADPETRSYSHADDCCGSHSHHLDLGDPDHTHHCHSYEPAPVPNGGQDHQSRDLNLPHEMRTEVDPHVAILTELILDTGSGDSSGTTLYLHDPVTDPTRLTLRCIVMLS